MNHYTDCVDTVKDLKRRGRYGEAERMLLAALEKVEAEASREGWGVAPWYYEQLAIIYRRQKRTDDEIRVLERFARQSHAPGAKPPKLLQRLEKARNLSRYSGPDPPTSATARPGEEA